MLTPIVKQLDSVCHEETVLGELRSEVHRCSWDFAWNFRRDRPANPQLLTMYERVRLQLDTDCYQR